MSDALVFTTAPKTSTVPDIEFTLDDRDYLAHGPKKAAWASLVHGATNASGQGIHAVLTFLDACLDPADQMYLEQRLRNRDDDLDVDDLLGVVNALVEEWEPYLGEEFAELTGENRATRRQAARRTPAKRTAKRQPARRPTGAPARQDEVKQ
ncbi:hypothetical protein ACWD2L_00460 [Streptomyces sp. NPDC002754]